MSPPSAHERLPAWVASADQALREASRRATTISSATPRNLRTEQARLVDAWERGHEATADLRHATPPDLTVLRRSLDGLADALAREGALGIAYAERAEELALEARMVAAIGTRDLGALSCARFGYRDDATRDAELLADAWASTPTEPEDVPDVSSDDPNDPSSLLSLVRAEVGTRRLPVRIVLSQNLSPLAAVGDGVVQIAEGRRLSKRDAERTALHEIEGHLVPQSRALLEPLGIFSFGTRRGSDDQEGRALWLERRAGLLVGARRAELGRRHLAARAVLAGSHFVDTVRLLRSRATPVADCVRLALRAHRGAHAGLGGLAREIVYLPAMLRVEARIAIDPMAEDVLARGRVAVDTVDVLRPFVAG